MMHLFAWPEEGVDGGWPKAQGQEQFEEGDLTHMAQLFDSEDLYNCLSVLGSTVGADPHFSQRFQQSVQGFAWVLLHKPRFDVDPAQAASSKSDCGFTCVSQRPCHLSCVPPVYNTVY